jgi:hypothetical protein
MFDILMTKLRMSNKFYILGGASGIVEDVNRGGRSQATNVGSIPIARSTFFSVESFVSRVITRFTHRYCRCADWADRAWNRIVNCPTYRTSSYKKVATCAGLGLATCVGGSPRGIYGEGEGFSVKW